LAVALGALACLLVPGAVLGASDPGGWQVLDRVLNHPYVFGVAVCGLVFVIAGLGVHGSSRRGLAALTALMTTVVIIGLIWGEIGSTDAMLAPETHETAQIAAPPGKPYRAITIQTDDGSSLTWTVYVRSGHGLLTRQWAAACPDINEIESVSWAAPDRLLITLIKDDDAGEEGGTFIVPINPRTGEPGASRDIGC
jgi:hypothetical protein